MFYRHIRWCCSVVRFLRIFYKHGFLKAILFLDEVHRDFPMVSPANGHRLNFERVPRTDFPKQAWRHFNRSSREVFWERSTKQNKTKTTKQQQNKQTNNKQTNKNKKNQQQKNPGIGLGRFSDTGQARFSTEDNGRLVSSQKPSERFSKRCLQRSMKVFGQ